MSNDSQGVLIEVEGKREHVGRFLATLEREAPPLAVIKRVTSREIPLQGDASFAIAPSQAGLERYTFVSPDVATCADCHELCEPANRRYRYALTNCTHCGPRFTIIRAVPYDRAATTMACFPCVRTVPANTMIQPIDAFMPSPWHARPADHG